MKGDTETDSDVSIEPYMAQGDDYGIVEEPPSEPMPEQTWEIVDVLLWHPRVLEYQPLPLILKNIRDPISQLGSLGALPLVISPASTASERILFEPVLSDEDTALLAEMDAKIPELFTQSPAGTDQESTINCIMAIAENIH